MKEPKLLISQIVGKTKYACFKSKAIIIKCVMFHYDSSLFCQEKIQILINHTFAWFDVKYEWNSPEKTALVLSMISKTRDSCFVYVKNNNLVSTIIHTHHWQTTDIILPCTVPTESRKNTKKISDSKCFQH